MITRRAHRLEHLISDMLDVSRPAGGRGAEELEEIGVEGILQAARRQILPRAQEAGIEVRVEAGANLTAMADEERVMQVLLILHDNALSFTPTGGAITLYARSEHGGEKTVSACGIRARASRAGFALYLGAVLQGGSLAHAHVWHGTGAGPSPSWRWNAGVARIGRCDGSG